jgi:hypothetical protein
LNAESENESELAANVSANRLFGGILYVCPFCHYCRVWAFPCRHVLAYHDFAHIDDCNWRRCFLWDVQKKMKIYGRTFVLDFTVSPPNTSPKPVPFGVSRSAAAVPLFFN